MVDQVVLIVVSTVFGALLSFFITTLSHKSATKTIALEVVKVALTNHELECNKTTKNEIHKLTKAMVFIVSEMGGNPNDYGLFQ